MIRLAPKDARFKLLSQDIRVKPSQEQRNKFARDTAIKRGNFDLFKSNHSCKKHQNSTTHDFLVKKSKAPSSSLSRTLEISGDLHPLVTRQPTCMFMIRSAR